MCRFTAAQPLTVVNDRFQQRKTGLDPLLPVKLLESVHFHLRIGRVSRLRPLMALTLLGAPLTHPVIHNSFDIASCSRKCLFLREAKVKLTKNMQNSKSLFFMIISHAKRLVYN